jgi:hypothetical protein
VPPQLVKITVAQNATQKNVSGPKNWAAVKKADHFIVEATTTPRNDADEWKQIQWSVHSGEAVQNFPNRRKLSLSISKKYHVEAKLGGVSDSLDVWVLWATVEILTKGPRPANAAPFDAGIRDDTQNLGAVTYKSLASSMIDEKAGVFVDNMGASGKIAAVATLSPKGVGQIVKAGWTFERQVWSHNWLDGVMASSTTQNWKKDTSRPAYLRLTPDNGDKIYDVDGPDLRWGQFSSETYNRFRQWIEWNAEKCSEDAHWHWRAQWKLHRDLSKQITLNELGVGDMALPSKAHFPVGKAP